MKPWLATNAKEIATVRDATANGAFFQTLTNAKSFLSNVRQMRIAKTQSALLHAKLMSAISAWASFV